MIGTRRTMVAALLLTAGLAGAARAQEATPAESPEVAAEASANAADRAYVRGVLERDEVRRAARIADVDLDRAIDHVEGLEGERLDRATRQAGLIDRALGGGAAQDRIVISATTVIIILLVILIIILAAN